MSGSTKSKIKRNSKECARWMNSSGGLCSSGGLWSSGGLKSSGSLWSSGG